MDKIILHCDLNNFYASVEQRLNPDLRGQPIAVCGDPRLRHGIVLAKSEVAKKFGVSTGDTIWQAQNKCPNLIVVPPHYDKYVEFSNEIFSIYTSFTDRVESFGMDECWLDVTGSTTLFGNGEEIAYKIKETVKKQTGLTISVGVSFSKVMSKLGSDMKKPDAITVLSRENFKQKCYDLPVEAMIFVGRQTKKRLNTFGIYTIGQLANLNPKILVDNFGIVGLNLFNNANGCAEEEDVLHYYDSIKPKSVSNGTTTHRDIENIEEAKTVIYSLSEMVATRLRKHNLEANGVSLTIKYPQLSSISRHLALQNPTKCATNIGKIAISLLEEMHSFDSPLRAITVGAINLSESGISQMCFFDSFDEEKNAVLEKSIDEIRKKYGYHSIKRGITMQSDILKDNLHEEDGFTPFKKN